MYTAEKEGLEGLNEGGGKLIVLVIKTIINN